MANSKQTFLTSLASATSANGTARNGASLPTNLIHPGTVLMECVGSITTASVVATYKLQATADNINWVDVKTANNAAPVTVAGGGGTPLAHAIALEVPSGIMAYQAIRGVATLSGASTAAEDVTSIKFRYVQPGGVAF
jgi:hypothetical protein